MTSTQLRQLQPQLRWARMTNANIDDREVGLGTDEELEAGRKILTAVID